MLPFKLLTLDALPASGKLTGAWLLMQLMRHAKPVAERLLQDPAGSFSRIGDVLFWQGESGRQVVGTLEALSESQQRIEKAVEGIESAQIGLAGSLGTLTSLSMATLGVTSFAAGYMIMRMNALHARLDAFGRQLTDIQADLKAHNQAHLKTSLDFLGRFEHTRAERDLHTALEEGTFATNLYREVVLRELKSQRRLLALNECGRYYMLALTTQVRCQILGEQLQLADRRLNDEKETLTNLARTTFELVMANSPEVYLDANLKSDDVTLDLVTEVHQRAHQLGIVAGDEPPNAGEIFENLRQRIYTASRWFRPTGKTKKRLVENLRFLIACLEDVGLVESLRIRVDEAVKGRLSLQDLETAVGAAREKMTRELQDDPKGPIAVFAYA